MAADRYDLPAISRRPAAVPRTAYLIASGDLRESANRAAWPTQEGMERAVAEAFRKVGWEVQRVAPVDPDLGHGFVTSQRMGLEIFKQIPGDAPLVVAIAGWQYSNHVLPGLRTHRGPLLTVGNFAPDWPGLVGLLGLNACLTKAGREFATIWSVDFEDERFHRAIEEWIDGAAVAHDLGHVRPLPPLPASPERELGEAVAAGLLDDKALIGVFDEGCMGMYNAIVDDELLNRIGIYKERLSQSALYAEMLTVEEEEAAAVLAWLRDRGMRFRLGTDEASELTEAQLLSQCAMYIAALRIADDFGLDAVGIQYQQGLKDLVPASDLAEGLLNATERPPVRDRAGARVLFEGRALPHFNEADEGAAIDALLTARIWSAIGIPPDTTLHDIRWGERIGEDFVWALEISGSVPASHLGGYDRAEGWRQDPVFFPAGGSTINGVCIAGELVWSRVFVEDGRLQVDLGRASAVDLPADEVERRKQATNPEWPLLNAVLHGVDRDQLMARHRANHLQVAYAPDGETADRALTAKAAAFAALGLEVHLCGDVPGIVG